MLTSLHHFKIAQKNDSVLLVPGLSMKFLSQHLLFQHFSELGDIGWQEISSLNRIFNFGSMQRYADREPHWCLYGEEGPAPTPRWLSCCHHKLLKKHSLGRKGSRREEEIPLAFKKNCSSFHWSFLLGCLMVCGNCCASAPGFLCFPSALASRCCAH